MSEKEEFDPEQEVSRVEDDILEGILHELADIENSGFAEEIYFHDVIHSEVDIHATRWNRQECLALIDYTGNEQYVDDGIIDTSSLQRTLVTMAFECVRQELFEPKQFTNEDSIIMKLQSDLNNEVITPNEAREIRQKIEEYRD